MAMGSIGGNGINGSNGDSNGNGNGNGNGDGDGDGIIMVTTMVTMAK
jgi:hypothetical protein